MLKQCHAAASLAMAVALGLTYASAQTVPSRPSQATNNQKLTQAEQHFLIEAIQGDLAEVNMGKLAQEKGEADEVKQFGQMLQQDHSAHLKQAEQMAHQMGITPPNSPNAKQQAMQEKLEKLSGSAFDKEFKQAMIKDHNEDIAKYRRQATSKGSLGEFAQETIPTLEKHLKQAHSLGRQAPTTGRRTKR
jgi:putative membrane protein